MLNFGNRTGHRAPPPGGKLQGIANFFGNVTTIVTGVIVLVAAYFYLGPYLRTTVPEVPSGPTGGQDLSARPDQPSTPVAKAPIGKSPEVSVEKQALAFVRAKQRQAADVGDVALRSVDECVDAMQQYNTLVKGLLTSEEGKKIAGDPSLLKRFSLVQKRDRPDPTLMAKYRQDVLGMVTPIKAALQSATDMTLPHANVQAELERIVGEARGQRDQWQKERVLVEVIAAEAKASATKPADKTLQEAIPLFEASEALAFTQAMEKETNRVREEMNKKAIEAKTEAIRALEQANIDKMAAEKRAEAERIRTEAFEAEAKVKREGEAARAKAEKERLTAKALDSKTKQTLAVFLARTSWQPKMRNGKVGNEQDFSSGDRLSFTRLKSVGALEPTPDGLAALAVVASHPGRTPRWQFEPIPATWSAGTRAMVQEVQELLRELGPTLVELKLLAP